IDTLARYGGLWSFDSGAMERISNQYAAMPSLHFAWSTWTFLVLFPHLRHAASRLAIAAYPWLTLFAIIVTANHYWLDAVGGAVVLGAGVGLSWLLRWAGMHLREANA
ncbi:MAG TPA: phosphatase PAP2 family protein, partial [Acidimicrobiales bacterium]|nr:phosphatase PAP2 family protein [Acidimicrobiales bacterium]